MALLLDASVDIDVSGLCQGDRSEYVCEIIHWSVDSIYLPCGSAWACTSAATPYGSQTAAMSGPTSLATKPGQPSLQGLQDREAWVYPKLSFIERLTAQPFLFSRLALL